MSSFLAVESYHPSDSGLTLECGHGCLRLEFVGEDLLRVRYAPDGTFVSEPSYVVEEVPSPRVKVELVERGDTIEVSTSKLRLTIHRSPFSWEILDRAGHSILEAPANNLEVQRGRARQGQQDSRGGRDGRSIQRFLLAADEGIYGLGQGTYPRLNLRDRERRMWHEWRAHSQSGPAGIPLMLSTRGYGFLLNSSWPSRFAIGKAELTPPADPPWAAARAPAPWPEDEHPGERDPERIAILLEHDQLDYFLIVRPTFPEILQGYAELTGFSPLPPIWALGYMQSRNRYRGAEEILEVARGYRKRGIPGDLLVIDWMWFSTYGDLTWDKNAWPDPPAMARELRSMGFKLMLAQHPFVDAGALLWEEFSRKGYLVEFPNATGPLSHQSIFDFSNPQARAAWWEKIRPLFDQGIRSYWTDMGEPAQHPVGVKHHLGSRERVHNIYPVLWAKALYDGQRSHTDERVFSLHRTAYAGIQRYGAALWSGDIEPSWDVLRRQVVIGQQVCMSGQPYWTTDIGGFTLLTFYDRELYVRWLQWGVWCPLFRTHGTRAGNEPWSFGPEAERIIRESIQLRYDLMPYIYAQAWHTHKTGLPMMQAMILRYPEDTKAVERDDQFMFGPSFLVAPVVEQGARRRSVYLPAGRWYDYWTDQPVQGPVEVEAFAPLDRIPVYVRAGSIVPKAPGMLHADEKPWDPLEVHVYPGQDGEFVLYEDDGTSYGYERGACATTRIVYSETQRTLVIHGVEGEYPGQLRLRRYRIVLHDQDEPGSVRIDQQSIPRHANQQTCRQDKQARWTYEPASRQLIVEVPPRLVEQPLSLVTAEAATGAAADPDHLDRRVHTSARPRMGVDVSQPEPRAAIVHAYIEHGSHPSSMSVDWAIAVPLGWRCSELRAEHRAYGRRSVASKSWRLEVHGDVFTPGSEVVVSAFVDRGGQPARLSETIHLTSTFNTHWYVVGPLLTEAHVGPDTPQGPETADRATSEAAGKSGGQAPAPCADTAPDGQPVSWQRYDGFDCLGYVNLRQITSAKKGQWDLMSPPGHWLAYASSNVWSPDKRSAVIELLGEDRFKVWLNGRLVMLASERPAFQPLRARVELQEGWNAVLLKCTLDATKEFGGRPWGFFFQLLDHRGRLMKDLRYTAGRPGEFLVGG